MQALQNGGLPPGHAAEAVVERLEPPPAWIADHKVDHKGRVHQEWEKDVFPEGFPQAAQEIPQTFQYDGLQGA
jgi:hypothetical protein